MIDVQGAQNTNHGVTTVTTMSRVGFRNMDHEHQSD